MRWRVANGRFRAFPHSPPLAALSREALELLAVLLHRRPASVSELVERVGL